MWSLLATMYQLGFDRQAVPSALRVEQVRVRRDLGRPDQPLLLLGQVASEAADAFGEQPDPPVGDLDVGEDVGDRELVLLAL